MSTGVSVGHGVMMSGKVVTAVGRLLSATDDLPEMGTSSGRDGKCNRRDISDS